MANRDRHPGQFETGAKLRDIGWTRECWRCRNDPDHLHEVGHPDPAVDRRVLVCADGCWLPERVRYRCHHCGRDATRREIRLVRAAGPDHLVPECLDCTREFGARPE